MKNPTVAFIPAKCNTTGKDFFIRADMAADGMWVSTYGVTSVSASEKGDASEVVINFSNHRNGPQYKCPHCGNKRIFLCTNCGVKACCYDGADTWRCPLTGDTGTFSSDHVKTISGSGGNGQ